MTGDFAALEVEAVLFDMDGTLVDSTLVVEQLWTEFAHQVAASAADVIAFAHGRPSRDTVARYAPAVDHDRWIAWITDAEHTRFSHCPAVPGADAFMRALAPGTWAVVTSALAEPAARRMAGAGLPVPQVLVGADSVDAGKPDPEGYLRAAKALGIDIRNCVVFEDTGAGLRAGRAAGAHTVAVGSLAREDVATGRRIEDFTEITVTAKGRRVVIERRPA